MDCLGLSICGWMILSRGRCCDRVWDKIAMKITRKLCEKYIHVAGLEATFCNQQIRRINLKWGYKHIKNALGWHDAVHNIDVFMAAEWLLIVLHWI